MSDVREELNRLADRVESIATFIDEADLRDAIAADLRALSARAAVPEAKAVPYGSASGEKDYGYGYEKGHADGWNACRDAMLAAAPQPNAACTCPSGDGSLRHPCPAHPTAATQPATIQSGSFQALLKAVSEAQERSCKSGGFNHIDEVTPWILRRYDELQACAPQPEGDDCPHDAWQEIGGWCKCETCGRGWSAAAAPQPTGEVVPRQPDGYAYRYPSQSLSGGTEIRFSHGQEINGSKPIEAVPYYFGTPPEPAPSAPAPINSPPEFPDNCVDSLAAADVEALEALVSACEADFTSEYTADEPDDEPVGYPPTEVTFGHVRRAREAIRRLSASATGKERLQVADLEALATSIGVYMPADPSCGSDGWWAFTAADLHDFARRLSGAQPAETKLEVNND